MIALCWLMVLYQVWWLPISLTVTAQSRLLHYPLGHVSHERNRRDLQTNNELEMKIFDVNEDHDGLYRGYGTHYVNLYVGCPSAQIQTVIIDTGSSTTGFPCSSCQGGCGEGYQLNPVYDETRSSCFRQLGCDECECGFGSSNCPVSVSYAEGSSWSGTESIDKVTIGSPDEEGFDLRFVCQSTLTGLFQTQLADGIAGLAKSTSSLWVQLHDQQRIDQRQFSLCLQNTINQPARDAGVLVFGGTDVRLHGAPMVFAREVAPYDFFWKIRIQNIFVVEAGGGRPKEMGKYAGVVLSNVRSSGLTPIVDSGTTYSYLDRSLEAPMREAWNQVTSINFGSSSYSPSEIAQMPTFWFQIEGWDDGSSSSSVDDIWIAFSPSDYLYGGRWRLYFDGFGKTVLGANFMSGHDVLFDKENDRIGFAESNCVLEEDIASSGASDGAPWDDNNDGALGANFNKNINSGASVSALSSGSSILLLVVLCFLGV